MSQPIPLAYRGNDTANDPFSVFLGWTSYEPADGDYEVKTTFDLTGFDISTVTMTTKLGVDNIWRPSPRGLFLNNYRIPHPNNLNLTVTTTTNFLPGINEITIRWANIDGPTGIRLTVSGSGFLL